MNTIRTAAILFLAVLVAQPSLAGGQSSQDEPGYLGINGQDVDNGGVKLIRVSPGSPAASAGLKEGDIVTEIDGKQV
jgi:S1-C subfamily serine protease